MKTKKIILNKIKEVLFIIFIMMVNDVFTQNFEWVKSFEGNHWDQGNSINVDQNGNIITTGHFQYTTDFDPSSTSTYNLNAIDVDGDVFISKIDSNGDFIWAKKIGGTRFDGAFSTLDNYGNIYSTGYFWNTADFDPSTNDVFYTSYYEADIFVNKLDSDGNYLWSKHFGGYGNDYATSIISDNDGNIYIAGHFLDTLYFFTDSNQPPLISNGVSDTFICKLDTNGIIQWVRQIGGTGYDTIESITCDTSNNIYFAGAFSDTVDFDPSSNDYNLIASELNDLDHDAFVCKYDSAGNFIWVKQFESQNNSVGKGLSIEVDESGNSYIAGEFNGVVDFNPNPNQSFLLTNDEYYLTPFFCKLNVNGNFVWAKNINVNITDANYPLNLKLDSENNIFVLGSFHGAYDFDPSNSVFALNSPNSYDIFICELDSNGNFIKSQKMGSLNGNDCVNDLFIDNEDNLFITGYYSGLADFDPSPLNEYFIDSNQGLDVFILKLNSNDLLNIDDLKTNNIQVFPNPIIDDKLTITSQNFIQKLEVYNTFGQLVIHQPININTIDTSRLKTGLYFIKIMCNNIIYTKKVIKR